MAFHFFSVILQYCAVSKPKSPPSQGSNPNFSAASKSSIYSKTYTEGSDPFDLRERRFAKHNCHHRRKDCYARRSHLGRAPCNAYPKNLHSYVDSLERDSQIISPSMSGGISTMRGVVWFDQSIGVSRHSEPSEETPTCPAIEPHRMRTDATRRPSMECGTVQTRRPCFPLLSGRQM